MLKKNVSKHKKTTAIINLGNRKHSLWFLRGKTDLRSLDSTDLDFPGGTRIFIIESLCAYYRGLRNKWKKLKGMGKFHVFFVSNSTIKAKILENNWVKPITHEADLKKMIQDINIDNLQFVGNSFFGLSFSIHYELIIYAG